MKDEFVVERRFQQKATKPKNYSGFKSKWRFTLETKDDKRR
jgi:hypothetical protein